MKVLALVFMLAVAVYARPPKMDDLEGGDKPDEGTKLFLNLVKLCIRLEEEAGSDDKRSWDAVFALFGGVCDGIKAEMEKELGDVDMPDKRSRVGPKRKERKRRSTFTLEEIMERAVNGDQKSGKGRKGPKSGPAPTGLPMSGNLDDLDLDDLDERRQGPKSGKGRKGPKSGPAPTGLPMSGDLDDLDLDDLDERSQGPKSGKGRKGPKSGPAPTGLPMSGDLDDLDLDDLDERRQGPKSGKGRKGPKSGPAPTGLPMSGDLDDLDLDDLDERRQGPKSGKGRKGPKSGPAPTGLPMSGDLDDLDLDDLDERSQGPKGKKGPKSGPAPTGLPMPPSPQQNLLKICFELVEMGEKEAGKADKRTMEEVLSGMEQVCLAAFTQAKDDGMGSD